MGPLLILILFVIIPVVVFLAVIIPVSITNAIYKSFILKHSVSIRTLDEINRRYTFKNLPNYNQTHSYDNENFYREISCKDYLTYQLIYMQGKVRAAIKDAKANGELFKQYANEINTTCRLNTFDTTELLKNEVWLKKIEEKLFRQRVIVPQATFTMVITLRLTNINGAYRTSKREMFDMNQIEELLHGINQKRGDFYTNDDIWHSICRVERGKVTNRLRFAVYQRDNYRCRMCGRRTNDLEVDHIYPIAKGGKTTFDNLQTLCHRCNVKKGDSVIY